MNKEKFFEFCFNLTAEILPETIIVTPFIPIEAFAEHCTVTKSFKGRLYSGIIAENKSRKFAVIFSGMGDRLSGDGILLMEKSPVRQIIFAGACGGLGGTEIGDLILCETAFNGEGFSMYHGGPSFSMEKIFNTGKSAPADNEYTKSIERFLSGKLEDRSILKKGDIFTIGSFLAETPENLLKIEQKNFIAIELELSSVYHAANLIGRKMTGLTIVSDLPKNKPLWEKQNITDRKKYTKTRNNLIKLLIEFAATS